MTANRAHRILIVEDDPDQLLGLKIQLEANKYEVNAATNVKAALEVATRTRPDMIILDLALPDGSGFDVLNGFQQVEEIAHTPVIVLTASACPENLSRSFESEDVVTFLEKPVSTRELLRTIEIGLAEAKPEPPTLTESTGL